jgi:two-component system, cell cycle sensor histidine kinase and response regulator CckA
MTSQPRLLVIDDNEVDRIAIRRALKGEFHVTEASMGLEGIRLFESQSFQGVLLDYRLPDIDGIEVLQHLVKQQGLVFMLTGQGDEQLAVNCLKSGAVDYFSKSNLEPERVRASITNQLEKAALQREIANHQEKIHQSQRRLSQILDSIPLGIIMMDSQKQITFENAKARKMFPHFQDPKQSHHSGEPKTSAYDWLSLHSFPICKALSGTSSIHSVDIINTEQDQTILGTGTPVLDDDQNIVYALGTFQDITEQRRLENQLRQSARMEAMGQLAGGIAHDFNNILTAILTLNRFVMAELGEDHVCRSDLEEVEKAAQRAERLTHQLLAFTKQKAIQKESLQPNDVVDDISKMLSRTLGNLTRLRCDLDPHAWPVLADRGALEQVVVNLAVNARDAMPNGGSITIKTENVVFDHPTTFSTGDRLPKGQFVKLSVQDNGIGISKEVQERMFEPFFTTKEANHGTGLGLATSHSIIAQAQGAIHVESKLGVGTTIEVYLAHCQQSVECPKSKPPTSRPTSGIETILIVEDNDQLRKLILRALKPEGYCLLQAENSEIALEIAQTREGTIDLIISDIMLGESDGLVLANNLFLQGKVRKVLMTSGNPSGGKDPEQRLDFPFLPKPFTPSQLTSKVRFLLNELEPLHDS